MKKIILFLVLILSFVFAQYTTETYAPNAPISFTGLYPNVNSVIDFTGVTLNYGGSSGPRFIGAGTYASPVSSADAGQSGMIRLYGLSTATSDDEASGYYDRAIFAYLRTDGSKGIFPIAGLAEVRTTSGNGPTAVMAGQFIADLNTVGAKLATSAGSAVDGMYAGWFKITAKDGATTHANSRKAALWVDNQMYGNNASGGEEYGIYATTGGLKPEAFIGFSTTSAGYEYMFKWDATSYDQDPVVAGDIDDNTSEYYFKVLINGVPHGVAMFEI